MSKKNKVSSGKKSKKNTAKAPKKKVAKSAKPASKKKPAKKPLPKKKVVKATKVIKKLKPIAKKADKKPLKAAAKKIITKAPAKVVAKAEVKIKNTELSKKPFFQKKDDGPIPEYKPTIKPTIKAESSSKEGFPSTLKSTSASSFITTPIKKVDSYSIKPEKEPAGKFELEFVIKASGELLYEFLITPSGLSEWFCDDVNIRNGIYTFVWDGQLQQARLLKTVEEQLVRYQWVDKTDGSYFEFRIQRDDLTNDVSLMIIDFANEKGEQESAKLLWASQIDKLLHVLGSYF